jgi:hypothetical protein
VGQWRRNAGGRVKPSLNPSRKQWGGGGAVHGLGLTLALTPPESSGEVEAQCMGKG